MEFHHILAPTDFSEYSQQAVHYARELARKFGATLVLLHVVELPPYPIEGLPSGYLSGTILEELEQQATSDLAQVLANEAEVKVVRRVAVGIPYRTIVEVAAPTRSTSSSWRRMAARGSATCSWAVSPSAWCARPRAPS